jgi:hypothetical protein
MELPELFYSTWEFDHSIELPVLSILNTLNFHLHLALR